MLHILRCEVDAADSTLIALPGTHSQIRIVVDTVLGLALPCDIQFMRLALNRIASSPAPSTILALVRSGGCFINVPHRQAFSMMPANAGLSVVAPNDSQSSTFHTFVLSSNQTFEVRAIVSPASTARGENTAA